MLLAACGFLTPFSPLSPTSGCLGGITPVTTQPVWQLGLHLELPKSLGHPAGMKQAWCFWKLFDLPRAQCLGRANMCLEFPVLLLLLKGQCRGSPRSTFQPDNQVLGGPGLIWRDFAALEVQLRCPKDQASWTGQLSSRWDLCESREGQTKPVVWLGVYAKPKEMTIWYTQEFIISETTPYDISSPSFVIREKLTLS